MEDSEHIKGRIDLIFAYAPPSQILEKTRGASFVGDPSMPEVYAPQDHRLRKTCFVLGQATGEIFFQRPTLHAREDD